MESNELLKSGLLLSHDCQPHSLSFCVSDAVHESEGRSHSARMIRLICLFYSFIYSYSTNTHPNAYLQVTHFITKNYLLPTLPFPKQYPGPMKIPWYVTNERILWYIPKAIAGCFTVKTKARFHMKRLSSSDIKLVPIRFPLRSTVNLLSIGRSNLVLSSLIVSSSIPAPKHSS